MSGHRSKRRDPRPPSEAPSSLPGQAPTAASGAAPGGAKPAGFLDSFKGLLSIGLLGALGYGLGAVYEWGYGDVVGLSLRPRAGYNDMLLLALPLSIGMLMLIGLGGLLLPFGGNLAPYPRWLREAGESGNPFFWAGWASLGIAIVAAVFFGVVAARAGTNAAHAQAMAWIMMVVAGILGIAGFAMRYVAARGAVFWIASVVLVVMTYHFAYSVGFTHGQAALLHPEEDRPACIREKGDQPAYPAGLVREYSTGLLLRLGDGRFRWLREADTQSVISRPAGASC